MRVIAGAFRGRRLHSPKGDKIRPTIDKVREAIFNIIASEIPGAKVLDLFAGTGAMGLEALSRGAAGCVFVDQSEDAIRLVRENVALCGVQEKSLIIRETMPSAIRRLASRGELFDLIFLDPPYGHGYLEKALEILETVAKEDAMIVAESHVKDEPPSHLKVWSKERERRYGDTLISIYSRE
jgi:16S rRNA (guanine966-N2)-methyltransferase